MFELMGANQPDDGDVAAERKITRRKFNRKPREPGAAVDIFLITIIVLCCSKGYGEQLVVGGETQ